MTIEALIFDLDGTMADTEEAHGVAFNLAFERHRQRLGLPGRQGEASAAVRLKTCELELDRVRARDDGVEFECATIARGDAPRGRGRGHFKHDCDTGQR